MQMLHQATQAARHLNGTGPPTKFSEGQLETWRAWFTPLAAHFAEQFNTWPQVVDHFIGQRSAFRGAFEQRAEPVGEHFEIADQVDRLEFVYIAFFWLFVSMRGGGLTEEEAAQPEALARFLAYYCAKVKESQNHTEN